MLAYGKKWRYNVYDCKYCSYWDGQEIGCILENGCCCPVPQKPKNRNGVKVNYDKQTEEPVSECIACPYGRDSPCIGWCTKEIMRTMGLVKNGGEKNV